MASNLRFTLLRGDDHLALEFECVNLQLETAGLPRLVPAANPALLIVHFPPQQITEETFPADVGSQQARSFLAGPSRLVFRVNAPFPCSLESLLDWNQAALSPVVPTPASAIDQLTTAIEFPYRLLLAPSQEARWKHRSGLATNLDANGGSWSELWQTTLDAPPGKRRVWAIGARHDGEADPFEIPIDAGDRTLIARQSRAQTELLGEPDLALDRLVLSSLGASIDLHGTWPSGELAGWGHNASYGRDQRSRVDIRGYLYPTGHQATMTKITERKFSETDGAAYLESRSYLTVTEAERTYSSFDLPFRALQTPTGRTIELDADIGDGGWPKVGGQPLAFQLSGIDQAKNRADFALPLGFVPAEKAASAASLLGNFAANAPLGGQALRLAEAALDDQSTTLATQAIDFAHRALNADPPFQPIMKMATVDIPAVSKLFGVQQPIKIKLPDIVQQEGIESARNPSRLFAEFVESSLPVAPDARQLGGMLAPSLNFVGLSRELGPVSGAPQLPPVQALQEIANARFDPVAFLGDQTKLFGVIKLADLFPPMSFTTAKEPPPDSDELSSDKIVKHINSSGFTGLRELIEEQNGAAGKYIKVPTLATRQLSDASGLPQGIDTTIIWKPKLKQPPLPVIKLNPEQSQFWLASTMAARANQEPDYHVEGHFTLFELSLLDVLTVKFKRLRFSAERGKRIELKPEISDITFDGPLKFVNEVQQALEAIGIDLPFGLDIQPSRIIASYALPLPSLSVGVFSLENVRLSSALTLPLLPDAGPVRIRFALSERSAPFLVTVSLIAGGGFFALEIATDGSMMVEAAIEFGGKFEIDLVVASGGVYLLGGIYFRLITPGNRIKLEGYLRCGGFVEILSIITISVEFYIGLSWEGADNPPRNVLSGTAKVQVCIEVLFLSKSVSFEVHKEFAGPSLASDRERIDGLDFDRFPVEPMSERFSLFERARSAGEWPLVSPDEWAAYCAAFA